MEDFNSGVIYNGNIFWLLEALKVVDNNVNFDMDFNNQVLLSARQSQLVLYDSLILNDDSADSLFFQIDNDIIEYFSSDKNKLILKTIKLYERKFLSNKSNKDNNISLNSELFVTKKELNEPKSKKEKELLSLAKSLDSDDVLSSDREDEKDLKQIKKILPEKKKSFEQVPKEERKRYISKHIPVKIYANLLLIYKNGYRKWECNYEIKKLLFYLKFMPNSKNIKIIKIFPPTDKDNILKTRTLSYINKDGQFTENKDPVKKVKSQEKKIEEEIFDTFVEKLKTIFSDKYGLVLQRFNIEVAEIDKQLYLLDVKEMSFEKFYDKDSKLKSERMYNTFQETYQHKNLVIKKDANNIKEIKSLYDCMMNVYDNCLKVSGIEEYLTVPKRDSTSDEVFKILKPDCPHTFSELLSDQTSKKRFIKYCSSNLWKEP